MSTIVYVDDGPLDSLIGERSIYLSLFERYIAYSLAWLSGIDVFDRTMYADGVFNTLRSAIISNGGIIFTDAQSFQYIVNPNAFKYKVIGVTKVLQVRSKTPCGPFNDVLAKIAPILDPSSCVLALGTWQFSITLAINALRSNAIPVALTLLSPLLSIPACIWEDWVAAIAASKAKSYCAILDPLTGLDSIALICGV
ncbi:MAG: hypothetical protein ACTS44_01960, partial [Candidatus Hodgkinia cicadicola]